MAVETSYSEIESKIKSGGTLSAAEMKEVMSAPTNFDDNDPVEIDDAEFNEPAVPSQKDKKPTAEPKKVEPAPKKAEVKVEDKPKTEAEEADWQVKLNRELEKPDANVDVKDFTPKEKGYFWEMRRERKARQKAEEELSMLKFNKIKDDTAKKLAEDKKVEDVDPFADRDENEPITIADAKKMMADRKKPQVTPETPQLFGVDIGSPAMQSYFKMCDKEARDEYGSDYDEVMECASDILIKNPTYQRQVGEGIMKGENTAKTIYNLMKGDPEFTKTLPIARARLRARGVKTSEDTASADTKGNEQPPAPKKALDAQKKLEESKDKPKTSAHAGGEEADNSKSYTDGKKSFTTDELLALSDFQFARVPKKIREQFMSDMG
jgi:hypothetical protein